MVPRAPYGDLTSGSVFVRDGRSSQRGRIDGWLWSCCWKKHSNSHNQRLIFLFSWLGLFDPPIGEDPRFLFCNQPRHTSQIVDILL